MRIPNQPLSTQAERFIEAYAVYRIEILICERIQRLYPTGQLALLGQESGLLPTQGMAVIDARQ